MEFEIGFGHLKRIKEGLLTLLERFHLNCLNLNIQNFKLEKITDKRKNELS